MRFQARRISRRYFAVTALAAAVPAAARAQQFSWKCGDGPSGTHPLNVRLTEAFAKIRAETDGRLDIRLFPNSALGSNTGMATQVRLGALEMMAGSGDDVDSYVPVATMDNVPFAYPNYDVAHRAFDGSLGSIIRYAMYAQGIFAFERVYDSGFREITTGTKPIRTVDDMQGLKVRVAASRFRLDLFRSLGASPAPVAYAETYSALQTRIVDAEENPLSGIEDLKFYEVQKYCSLSHHMWAAFWIMVNKEKWNGLPRDLQAIARKHINAGALLQRVDTTALEKGVRGRLERRGLIFNEVDVSGFRAKLKATGFYARWRETWGPAVWGELEKYSGSLL